LGLVSVFAVTAAFGQMAPPAAPGAPAAAKTRVKGYTKTLKNGKTVSVKGYTRTAKPAMPKMTRVKGYTKTLKSGKTVAVKGYTRKAPMAKTSTAPAPKM